MVKDIYDISSISKIQKSIILDIEKAGPDCAKFISRRLNVALDVTMKELQTLEHNGWIERVKGTFLMKKGLRRPKHMNHTYYDLTRQARLFLRNARRGGCDF